jgi:hypothetical protein
MYMKIGRHIAASLGPPPAAGDPRRRPPRRSIADPDYFCAECLLLRHIVAVLFVVLGSAWSRLGITRNTHP